MNRAEKCWKEIEEVLKKYDAGLIHRQDTTAELVVVVPDKGFKSSIIGITNWKHRIMIPSVEGV